MIEKMNAGALADLLIASFGIGFLTNFIIFSGKMFWIHYRAVIKIRRMQKEHEALQGKMVKWEKELEGLKSQVRTQR